MGLKYNYCENCYRDILAKLLVTCPSWLGGCGNLLCRVAVGCSQAQTSVELGGFGGFGATALGMRNFRVASGVSCWVKSS